MARYAAGDDVAFGELFGLLAPQIRGFFLRSFVDKSLVEDLTQTTFLKLHRARASYRPELPFKPWIFAIAAHVRQDELRRLYRLAPHVSEEEIENAELDAAPEKAELHAPLANPDGSSALVAVEEAIAALPESQRVVLHLHNRQEMTFEEIAEVLGTSAGTIRVRASRAYERLRKALRGHYKPTKLR